MRETKPIQTKHIYIKGYWVDLMCVRLHLTPYIDVFLS